MIQFTEAEIQALRKKASDSPETIEKLKQHIADTLIDPILVPKTGIGNWSLYYYCPKCSVQLVFDRHDGKHHHCPSCGQILTGEPYDGAWWWIVSMKNYESVLEMGLLFTVTGEKDYAQKAISIMTEYAKYYKDYEIHGNIPYNGPGKAAAQTLDEANFLRSFAIAYDLLEAVMTEEEKTSVREKLLLPGAAFLMEHRHRQLHNHEVIINSAIAIIGIIFDVRTYIQEAIYEKYGLLYQLEQGMLNNHMWFEGAFGYHFYALMSFFAYEKFALHTAHSHIHHPNYKAMMELLVSYLEPGFRIPMLNDTNYRHSTSSLWIYEFAYREIGGNKLLYILNQLYGEKHRDNQESFFYGVDKLPAEAPVVFSNYHVPEGCSGCTILRNDNSYLLFKHDCYGGEHDHYDRLAISYLSQGKRISPDLGTTGYGAVLHYDYYKNTGTHNTVMIGEENQAPVNGVLTRYEEADGVIYAEAKADWTAPYQMPDSFTIVQWKEENYRNVKMERKIAWTDDYFAEVFVVKGADPTLSIDWIMHFSGERIFIPEPPMDSVENFSDKKPFCHFHEVSSRILSEKGCFTMTYKEDDIITTVYGMENNQTLFAAKGPDNPSVSDICWQVERKFGKNAVFAHVITSGKEQTPLKVTFEHTDSELVIHAAKADGVVKALTFAL